LDRVAGSDYPIYQLLIKDWLKEKRNKINLIGEEYLLESVASVSASFIDNITEYRKMQDENKYNTLLCGFLNQRFSSKGWCAKDQSLGGSSNSASMASKSGIAFRDIVVADEMNHHISAMECFRLKYVPAQNEGDSEITEHLTKLFRYEPLGLSPLFILVYCETKSFVKTWEKYLNYIDKIDFSHIRETNVINVYHVFINMNP
jgi:hypothetical protein